MKVKFGILPYDEDKVYKTSIETPAKLAEVTVNNDNPDVKNYASKITEAIFSMADGKDKFRYYFETEKGYKATAQYSSSMKKFKSDFEYGFLEEMVYDDLLRSHNIKTLSK